MTATLFVDVETSDLLKKHLPLDDDAQPWCVRVSAQLDVSGQPPQFFNLAVKADGRKIREGAERVHGVSSRSAAKHGMNEVVVLGALCNLAAQAECVVGHGIQFDRDVITGVLMRRGKDARLWTRAGLAFQDTMILATPFCRLPSVMDDGGFKWPSLDEACSLLLSEAPREGHHDAWDDLQRTRRLWAWLVDRNAVEAAA